MYTHAWVVSRVVAIKKHHQMYSRLLLVSRAVVVFLKNCSYIASRLLLAGNEHLCEHRCQVRKKNIYWEKFVRLFWIFFYPSIGTARIHVLISTTAWNAQNRLESKTWNEMMLSGLTVCTMFTLTRSTLTNISKHTQIHTHNLLDDMLLLLCLAHFRPYLHTLSFPFYWFIMARVWLHE